MGVTPDRPKKFVHIVRIGQESLLVLEFFVLGNSDAEFLRL